MPWEIFLEALIDSLKLLPFLFLIYVLIELVENNPKVHDKTIKLLNGKASVLVASSVGIIPQCGFSVVCANLFDQNYIKLGTLMAVLIATSDEALPIMLENVSTIPSVGLFLLIKFGYALIVGMVVNLLDKRSLSQTAQTCQQGCCNHELNHERKPLLGFFVHPLIHTFKIFAYVLAINVLFALLFYFVGETTVVEFVSSSGFLQVLCATLVGLVPNCASSVLLAKSYAQGVLSFSATIAGLCSNSGLAIAVLFKNTKEFKRNLFVLALLFISSLTLGYLLMLFAV